MTDETVNIEINGTPLQARKGAMIIEVADDAGIRIPRFCYHHKLSVAANCRMCLVEVEKAPKPLPACATPVMDGMKVYTRSPVAIEAQKGTMEFLLINHPLDCPICDQGGECELQDVAMGYGSDISRYTEGKRVVADKDIGPLISTDMTRCIHCTRCVRFGQEVAGIMELGAPGRGENMRITTYMEEAVGSEMSGNVIDLCPVGALNAKPSRMRARAWELTQRPSVAPHDTLGSNIHFHTLRGQVIRTVPRDNEAINECWISDRDRFSYEGLNSDQRLLAPMVKRNGAWEEVDWEEALQTVAEGLRGVCDEHGADQLGALVSPSATTEEMYLLNRLVRALGGGNIDHRLRCGDFSDQENAPLFPWLGQNVAELEQVEAALLVGSNIRKEQPIAAHRLRKAALNGARVMFVNTRNFPLHFEAGETIACHPDAMVGEVAAVAKAVLDCTGERAPHAVRGLLEQAQPDEQHRAMADALHSGAKSAILLGSQAMAHPAFSALRALSAVVAEACSTVVGYLPDGANSAGAWLAGAVPHRGPGGQPEQARGLDARAMLESPRRAYLLHQVEPDYDCWDPSAGIAAMAQAEFVAALTPFDSPGLRGHADVLLPTAPYAETSGTYINVEGTWQSFAGANRPSGESRPGWKVLRVMGNMLGLSGFDYVSSDSVLEELRQSVGEYQVDNRVSTLDSIPVPEAGQGIARSSGIAPYGVDGIVRRAVSLQETADGQDTAVRINPTLAGRLGLQHAERVLVRQGECQVSMSLKIDSGVPDNSAWIPTGTSESAALGAMFGPIELEAD